MTQHSVRDLDVPDTRSPYERLGGSTPVRLVVERFYEKVLADDTLAPYFDGVDLPRQRRHLAQLIGQLLGGPRTYDGRDLAAAHRHLDITEHAYDAVVTHLVATLREFSAPEDIVALLCETVAEVRPLIVSDPVPAT